jgi:hypothetical protein
MIRWWSTRCFLATWVTFEAQSDSRDVKWDLSLAMSGIGSNRGFFRLVSHYFNLRMCILVLISLFHFTGCHTSYSASNGRNSPRFGVRTNELWPSYAWGVKSNLIAITGVLAQNWFKTAWLLRTDDSMVIYTLFSSNLGHIWGAVGLSWCKTGPIIGDVGTGPNGGFFRPVGH